MNTVHRAGLRIDLHTPTIFSAAAATTGGHASLDTVPGAALLGLAASWQEAWQAGLAEPVWTVLRSGGVRFGPGYPVDAQGRVLLPVPRALHTAKASTDGGPFDPSRLHNLAVAAPAGLQLKQIREGFLNQGPKGIMDMRPRKVFVMKTAVDPDTGTAMDAMLFGYEALAPGQSFYAEIEADAAALDAGAFEALVGALAAPQGRVHRMGRSRASEFGRVTIHRVAARPEAPPRPRDRRLVLWALSDLALVDVNGEPTLDPASADLGLPELAYRPQDSFVGTRRYAPYVGRWRTSDVERHVIAAGSVLVFEGAGAASAAATLHARGIGLERAAGLGRVWVNPPALDPAHLTDLPDWHCLPAEPVTPLPAPTDNPLFAWLDGRTRSRTTRNDSDRVVDAAIGKFRDAYRSATAYSGLRPDGFAGPSKSQWNQVASAARDARNADSLAQALFGPNGIVAGQRDHRGQPRTDPAWGWRVSPDRDHADTLRGLVADLRERDLDVPRALAAIAQGVVAELGRRRSAPASPGARRPA